MGIEVLLRTTEPTARTIAAAKGAATSLTLVSERSHNDSVRLVFEEAAGKQFILTVQSGGEIHAESFGAPRNTQEADLAVIGSLLPHATIVGSNPSWDSDVDDR